MLTALSPLDGRYHEKLDALRPYLSEFGLMHYRVKIEIAWLKALAEEKIISNIDLSCFETFTIEHAEEIKKIEQTTNHDMKAVEYFIKQKLPAEVIEFVHFACTSEDINNLSYALMLKDAHEQVILPKLNSLIKILKNFAHQFAAQPMLARTHGQAASPTTVGKEFANFVARLQQQIQYLSQIKFMGKINGAVGNFNAHMVAYPEIDWLKFSEKFVTHLNLTWQPYTTQIEPHDFIAQYCDQLVRVNTILIDLCRDIWGYIAWDYFKQKMIAGEIGSSTMPHKVNPIDFENAEGNFGVANALAQHMSRTLPISRWQRDLTDSTLLRNLSMVVGYSFLAQQSLLKGLGKLEINSIQIDYDLQQHWEVLAEAIQTVMRRYGIEKPYEKLKELTRGKSIDQTMWLNIIGEINLPENIKTQLKNLSPNQYLGLAETLARNI